jgi:hypothetical protein
MYNYPPSVVVLIVIVARARTKAGAALEQR